MWCTPLQFRMKWKTRHVILKKGWQFNRTIVNNSPLKTDKNNHIRQGLVVNYKTEDWILPTQATKQSINSLGTFPRPGASRPPSGYRVVLQNTQTRLFKKTTAICLSTRAALWYTHQASDMRVWVVAQDDCVCDQAAPQHSGQCEHR